jgi:hypothetical protein
VPSGGKKKSPDKFLFIVIYSQPLDKEKDGHTREKERDHNCQLILALSRKEKRA